MTEPSELVTETTLFCASGAEAIDVLSDALRVFRVSGAALLRAEYTEPWGIQAPPAAAVARFLGLGAAHMVIFHIIARGRCWVALEDGRRIDLEEGDIIGFPHGDAHSMGNGLAEIVQGAALLPPPPWTHPPYLVHGGPGEPTLIECVYLRCDDLPFNPLLAGLPRALVIRRDEGPDAEWVAANVRYLVRAASDGRAGASRVVACATEMMFVEILRLHMVRADETSFGWLAALKDRHVRRILQAFHAHPLAEWSAEAAAREAGLSPTALKQRFQKLLGMSPMRYLTMWRLQLGAQALLNGQTTIADAAEAAGYGSEEAFSRAFRRFVGTPPAEWRRQRPAN